MKSYFGPTFQILVAPIYKYGHATRSLKQMMEETLLSISPIKENYGRVKLCNLDGRQEQW